MSNFDLSSSVDESLYAEKILWITSVDEHPKKPIKIIFIRKDVILCRKITI